MVVVVYIYICYIYLYYISSNFILHFILYFIRYILTNNTIFILHYNNTTLLFSSQSVNETAELYRAVGKAFVFTPKKDVETRLEQEITELTKAQRDLTDREEYLSRRVTSHMSNLKDLVGQ